MRKLEKSRYMEILEELERLANGDSFNDPPFLASSLHSLAYELERMFNHPLNTKNK